MDFDELEYTRDSLAKQLLLIENHSKDGSVFDGCTCIEEKHLLTVEALAEEGVTIAKDEKEKQFYRELADLSRNLRKTILEDRFGEKDNPIHWTVCEKAHPEIQRKIEKCVLQVKEKDNSVNPYAVCRSSIPCP